jgi:transcriptional regulator with XRE-family HTH domain
MKFEKTFGETVKILRKKKQLPLREVAEALEIDTSMLGKIERNHRKPSKELIRKFALFYQVCDKDLMIAFLSDTVAYHLIDDNGLSSKVLKVAERKVKYLKNKELLDQ